MHRWQSCGVNAGDRQEPMLHGRGLLPIGDFRNSTGLDQSSVQALIQDGTLQAALHADGRIAGLLDDTLPTAEELRSLGLTVSSDYDPDLRRSDELDEDKSNQVEEYTARPAWTMPEDRGSD